MTPEQAESPPVQGTPWRLGVACDGPTCDTIYEGDFLVAEDSTANERLQVVLDHVERHGWQVIRGQSASASITYCPPCAQAQKRL